jgi:hypothetical protein
LKVAGASDELIIAVIEASSAKSPGAEFAPQASKRGRMTDELTGKFKY